MATIQHSGYAVDVFDKDCGSRSCFGLGFDKGTFVQGRGYTSYHAKPRPVCMTRHLNGCPHRSDVAEATCGRCHKNLGRVTNGEPLPESCPCGSTDIYRLRVLLDPTPCCDAPTVTRNPRAYRQRCRECGQWLTGWRLQHARGLT